MGVYATRWRLLATMRFSGGSLLGFVQLFNNSNGFDNYKIYLPDTNTNNL